MKDRLRLLLTPGRFGVGGVLDSDEAFYGSFHAFHVEFLRLLKLGDGLADRYRRTMASAMMAGGGVVLFRCPGCERPTLLHTEHSPAYQVMADGRKVLIPPWRTRSGTSCLWCHRGIYQHWLTGWTDVSRWEKELSVPAAIMSQVLGEAA